MLKTLELNKEEIESLSSYLVARSVILSQYIAMFRVTDKPLFDRYVAEKRLADGILTKILKPTNNGG